MKRSKASDHVSLIVETRVNYEKKHFRLFRFFLFLKKISGVCASAFVKTGTWEMCRE